MIAEWYMTFFLKSHQIVVSMNKMIYDVFRFFNELDLLEIRLNLLYGHVDKFILVEATTTYSGIPKPLYYLRNTKRFAKFKDKIVHIIVDDLPRSSKDRWPAEVAQRMATMRGLTDAQDGDIVIISDLDEIWNPKALPANITAPVVFQQKAKAFYLNARHDREWLGSIAIPYKQYKKERVIKVPVKNVFDTLRLRRKKLEKIVNGGWHWSYLGGKEKIIYKIESFAHSEFDNEEWKAAWVGMGERQKENCYLPPENDPDWPQWLKDNWKNYPNLVNNSMQTQKKKNALSLNNVSTLDFILKKHSLGKKSKAVKIYGTRHGTLPTIFRQLGFTIGAEIGVAQGYFSKHLLRYVPNLKLYSIDAWKLFN